MAGQGFWAVGGVGLDGVVAFLWLWLVLGPAGKKYAGPGGVGLVRKRAKGGS